MEIKTEIKISREPNGMYIITRRDSPVLAPSEDRVHPLEEPATFREATFSSALNVLLDQTPWRGGVQHLKIEVSDFEPAIEKEIFKKNRCGLFRNRRQFKNIL